MRIMGMTIWAPTISLTMSSMRDRRLGPNSSRGLAQAVEVVADG